MCVLAGWEGSAHDSVVLKVALKRSNEIPLPEVAWWWWNGNHSRCAGARDGENPQRAGGVRFAGFLALLGRVGSLL